ncbi:MAG: BON domain-containing protein [Pseudomonadota bacterium]
MSTAMNSNHEGAFSASTSNFADGNPFDGTPTQWACKDNRRSLWQRDQEVAETVSHVLQWVVGIPRQQVQSSVSNGWVTLRGHVSLHYKRFLAQEATSRISGVKGVRNLIDVLPDY